MQSSGLLNPSQASSEILERLVLLQVMVGHFLHIDSQTQKKNRTKGVFLVRVTSRP
jgi:hypothetical protein